MTRKLLFVLVGFACTSHPPTRTTEPQPPVSISPTTSAPPAPREAAPAEAHEARFTWHTVNHETIHARVLVPNGGKADYTRDAYGYPRVHIAVDEAWVSLQFDSGIGHLASSLGATPPTVHGLPTEKVQIGSDHVALRYRTKMGDLRIMGYAPGVTCSFETFREVPEPTLERIFTVCASLRSPPLGAWRRATSEERAHGGMTDVPEGGWVEPGPPQHPGRFFMPGKFVARLYLGGLVINGAVCPPSLDMLQKPDVNEAAVEVEVRSTAAGDAWIRKAIEEYDAARFPGTTVIYAARAGGCCRAEFVPWTAPPTSAQIDQAIALCDTYRPS
jgi:hypothetical protein